MAVSYQTHRSDLPLDERTYIVSGAGGGIGGAVVARLLRTGANVVGADLSGKRVAGTAQATQDLPGKLEVVKSDLTTEDGVAQVVETALETFGSVQGVANVAGGMVNINQDVYDVPLADYSLQDFIAMFALNVNSAFLMCARSSRTSSRNAMEDRQRRLPGRVREPAGARQHRYTRPRPQSSH